MSDRKDKKKDEKKEKKDGTKLKPILKKTTAYPSNLPKSTSSQTSDLSTSLYLSKRDAPTKTENITTTQKQVTFRSTSSIIPTTKNASSLGSQRTVANASVSVSGSSSTATSSTKSATKTSSTSSSSTKKETTKQASTRDKSTYKSQTGNQAASKYSSISGSHQSTKMKSVSGSMKPAIPSFAKSSLETTKDKQMAKRQLEIESLSPNDRKKQEKWAQEQIHKRAKAACPSGRDWRRVNGGYLCEAKGHLITDELLHEGKGGLCFLDLSRLAGTEVPEIFFGPYYYDDSRDLFKYGGRLPKEDYVPEAWTWIIDPRTGLKNPVPVVKGLVSVDGNLVSLGDFVQNRKEHTKAYFQYCTELWDLIP